MQHAKPPAIYWPELDGLRAIAFLLVFSSHCVPPPSNSIFTLANKFCAWGWTGVDLFFVLSGFLITYLLFREKKLSGTISISRFYKRRALRIWPLYFFVLLVISVFPLTIHHWNSVYRSFLVDVVFPFLCFAGNYALIWHFGAISELCTSFGFSLEIFVGLLVPLWSLCIEEQFYLFWPNMLKAARTVNGIYFAVGICFLFSFAVKLYLVMHASRSGLSHSYYYMDSFTHFESLMIGAALGIIDYERRYLFANISKRLGGWLVASFILIFCSIVLTAPTVYERHLSIAPVMTLMAVSFGALLVLAKGWLPFKKILSCRALVSIGKVSYAMYLFHLVIIRSFNTLVAPLVADPAIDWLMRTPVILLITWGVAQASWNVLEKRFLKARMNLAKIDYETDVVTAVIPQVTLS